MPPRFLERMEKQAQVYKEWYGGVPLFEPPPYSFPKSKTSLKPGPTRSSHKSLPQYSPIESSEHVLDKQASLALPADSLVLVIDADGWQGMHVVDQLMEDGYCVRGTVRDTRKAAWASRYFDEKYGTGRYSATIVPDMIPPGAFNTAVAGCAGVIHCASVTTLSTDPVEVITPSTASALNLLEAAAREPCVKRFVYCTFTPAAADLAERDRSHETNISRITSSFLNARQPPPYQVDRAWTEHSSSKTKTEEAVWQWYSDHRPLFALDTVECFFEASPSFETPG